MTSKSGNRFWKRRCASETLRHMRLGEPRDALHDRFVGLRWPQNVVRVASKTMRCVPALMSALVLAVWPSAAESAPLAGDGAKPSIKSVNHTTQKRAVKPAPPKATAAAVAPKLPKPGAVRSDAQNINSAEPAKPSEAKVDIKAAPANSAAKPD